MWRRACFWLWHAAGCAGGKSAGPREAKMMRARGIVLAGIVVAGVLGVNVQAGTVLDEPDDSALGWWSEGAGDEGIGSAPLRCQWQIAGTGVREGGVFTGRYAGRLRIGRWSRLSAGAGGPMCSLRTGKSRCSPRRESGANNGRILDRLGTVRSVGYIDRLSGRREYHAVVGRRV